MAGFSGVMRRMVRAIEAQTAKRGYQIQWQPDDLQHEEHRLEADLELAITHLLFEKPKSFFLEIGANDGKANDPLFPFIRRGVLSGLLLEPVPSVFARLLTVHGDNPQLRCINAALARTDGEADFFTVNMEGIAFEKAEQFSSFHRESLLKQTSWVPDIADRIVTVRVPTISFATLLRTAREFGAENIDILHTDTEGFDGEVLDMMWESGLRPPLVNFERLHMTKAEINRHVSRFTQAGYRVAMGNADIVAYNPPVRLGYR